MRNEGFSNYLYRKRGKEWLKIVIDDARKTCNDFNEPMISLGAGIAIGIVIKHIDELMKRKWFIWKGIWNEWDNGSYYIFSSRIWF